MSNEGIVEAFVHVSFFLRFYKQQENKDSENKGEKLFFSLILSRGKRQNQKEGETRTREEIGSSGCLIPDRPAATAVSDSFKYPKLPLKLHIKHSMARAPFRIVGSLLAPRFAAYRQNTPCRPNLNC